MPSSLGPEAAYELLGLLEVLGRPPRQPRGGPQHRAAEAFLARSDIESFGYRRDGELAGAAVVLFLPRLGYATPEALRLESGHARTDSHGFYERLGFRDRARDCQLEVGRA